MIQDCSFKAFRGEKKHHESGLCKGPVLDNRFYGRDKLLQASGCCPRVSSVLISSEHASVRLRL